MLLFSSDPETDRWITPEELAYIKADHSDKVGDGSRKAKAANKKKAGASSSTTIQCEDEPLLEDAADNDSYSAEVGSEKSMKVPWLAMASSGPVWAIIAGNTVANWYVHCLPQKGGGWTAESCVVCCFFLTLHTHARKIIHVHAGAGAGGRAFFCVRTRVCVCVRAYLSFCLSI